jgi:chromate transporter
LSVLPEAQELDSEPDTSVDVSPPVRITLLQIAATFLRLGTTTFGGMWASIHKLEDELVHRRGWLSEADVQFSALAATMLPAPKFLSLGGLVGFRLRGWPGGVIAILCLLAPSASIVLLGVILLDPALLDGPLAPMRRTVGIAVVGLLFGNAYQQLAKGKVMGVKRTVGVGLGLAVAVATIAGVPLLLSALLGFVAGMLLIKRNPDRGAEST